MEHSTHTLLARLRTDRRQEDRRAHLGEETLSLFEAFERDEREAWRRLDRRIALRREADVRKRIAKQ